MIADRSGRPRLVAQQRLPEWFRIDLSRQGRQARVRQAIDDHGLNTVCRSAACPNSAECWSAGTATFMILGDVCTRGCRFCNVAKGDPLPLQEDEPRRVAKAVAALGLNYAVITSVTRDDLSDGGAAVFVETIQAIRDVNPGCQIEILIPDLRGSLDALNEVIGAAPDVLNHNLETVPSLYARVRPQADYARSLRLLAHAASAGCRVKTGLMVGLGETFDELVEAMRDAAEAGCSILSIGQYLRPSSRHLPVERYYHPDEFAMLERSARSLGFSSVMSGPLVRSSYHAGEQQHALR